VKDHNRSTIIPAEARKCSRLRASGLPNVGSGIHEGDPSVTTRTHQQPQWNLENAVTTNVKGCGHSCDINALNMSFQVGLIIGAEGRCTFPMSSCSRHSSLATQSRSASFQVPKSGNARTSPDSYKSVLNIFTNRPEHHRASFCPSLLSRRCSLSTFAFPPVAPCPVVY
jgi:hypothetical protein